MKPVIGLAVFLGSLALAFAIIEDKIFDLDQTTADLEQATEDIEDLQEENARQDRKQRNFIQENRAQICATVQLVGDFPRTPLPGESPAQMRERFAGYENYVEQAKNIDCKVVLQRDERGPLRDPESTPITGTPQSPGSVSPAAPDPRSPSTPPAAPPPPGSDPDPPRNPPPPPPPGGNGGIVGEVNETTCELMPALCQ